MTVEAHDERLRVPLWWWPAALGLGGALAAEVHAGQPGLRAWLPYVVVLPTVSALLWWAGRVRVRVADSELFVDDAHLPLRYVSTAVPVAGEAKRTALGPRLSALAFVVHRPWVRGAVKLTLDDPADPTPYWIISSRRPADLAAAIIAGSGSGSTVRHSNKTG
ncbi:MAG: DUF3093 domain-containing protein [Pseudonocardiales bacterium]|nr:MAG: DUF3093 domain-containing protein [Pseudonocardiales bacterium]